jgi:fibronectin type 3 domain-containing protein
VADPQFDHYRIERDTTGVFGEDKSVFTTTDTTYNDFPIYNTLVQYYRVLAVSTGGSRSAPSDTVSAAPLQTNPAAPVGLTLTPGNLVIDIEWNSVAAADLDHYRIERDTTALFGPGTVTYTTPDTTYVDSSVVAGKTYYYAVVAVDWVGLESPPSDTESVVSTDLAPSAPGRLRAQSGANSVVLSWDDNSEFDLDGYVVYRDTIPAFGPEDSLAFVSDSAFEDTTGASFEIYWYAVTAKDLGGNESAYSDTVGGVSAPGGAIFVDVENTGVELGTFDNPFNTIQEGIDEAVGGQAVVVAPGSYAGGVTLDKNILVIGMAGASSTSIVSGSYVPVTVTAVNDSARLTGFTLDGAGTAPSSLECSAADIVVENCVLQNGNVGAKVYSGSQATFAGNTFTGNQTGLACEDSARPHLVRNTFVTSTLANVSSSGTPGPLVGGSHADANDFLGTGLFMVLNTGPAIIDAEYNFWSDACVDSTWFLGAVDYTPWTDSLHVATYTECPGTGVDEELPVRFALRPNVPNPFNPVTRIAYDVPSPGGPLALRVYSASGRLVRTLVDRLEVPGRHSVAWDGTDNTGAAVASGVYFYRLDAAGFSDGGKMVLLK